MLRASGQALAAAAGTQLVEPLLDPRFVASLAQHGTRHGYATRDAAMRTLFGGLLPEAVLSRSAKARFTRAFWGAKARSFAEVWEGETWFADLADPERLRGEWLREVPDFRSATALQAVWLDSQSAKLAVAGAREGASQGPGR